MDGSTWPLLGLLVPCALLVVPRLVRAAALVTRAAARALTRPLRSLRAATVRAGAGRALGAGLGLGAAAATAAPVPAVAQDTPPVPDLRSHHRPPAVAHDAVDAAPAAPAVHVVRPGESLWSISADRLGPHATDARIAADWPRWYRANRAAIGPDPSLLRVGVRLRTPSSAHAPRTDVAPQHRRSTGSTRTTDRRTGTSASPQHADPTPARPAARPTVRADSLDPDRR